MTLKLTEATVNTWGSVECTDDLTITKWICKFKLKSSGGTGGKRTLFCFYVDDLEAGLPSNGYYVSFNEESDKVALIQASAGAESILWESSLTNIDDGNWHEVEIRFDEGVVEVEWDDSRVLMYEIPSPDYTYKKWGFYAECSTYTNEHWIDDLDMFALMPFRDLRTMDREDIWRFRPLFWRVMRSPLRIHMPIGVRGISIKGRGSEGAPIELYSRFPVKISARKKPLIWHITPDVKGFGDYDGIQIDIDTKNQFMKIGTPTVDLFKFSESGSAEFYKDLRILKDDAKITFGSAEDITLERESATVLKLNSIMKTERDAPAFFVMLRKDIGREWFWGVTSLGRLYLRDFTGGISVLQAYPDTGKLDFNYETVMKGRSTFEADFLLKDQGTAGVDTLVKVVDGVLLLRNSTDTGYLPIDLSDLKIGGTIVIDSNKDVRNIRLVSPLVKDVGATPTDALLKVVDGVFYVRDSGDTSYLPVDISSLKIGGTQVISSAREASFVDYSLAKGYSLIKPTYYSALLTTPVNWSNQIGFMTPYLAEQYVPATGAWDDITATYTWKYLTDNLMTTKVDTGVLNDSITWRISYDLGSGWRDIHGISLHLTHTNYVDSLKIEASSYSDFSSNVITLIDVSPEEEIWDGCLFVSNTTRIGARRYIRITFTLRSTSTTHTMEIQELTVVGMRGPSVKGGGISSFLPLMWDSDQKVTVYNDWDFNGKWLLNAKADAGLLQSGEVDIERLQHKFSKCFWGDGSDGDKVVSSDEQLTSQVYQFNTLTINAGVTLTGYAGAYTVIFVKDTLTLNGTLKAYPWPAGGTPANTGGAGGDGGGCLFIFAKKIVGSGSIIANGENGGNGVTSTTIGSGGGDGTGAYWKDTAYSASEGGSARVTGGTAGEKIDKSDADVGADIVQIIKPIYFLARSGSGGAGGDGTQGANATLNITADGGGGGAGGSCFAVGGNGADGGSGGDTAST